jgi:hypothetical protein
LIKPDTQYPKTDSMLNRKPPSRSDNQFDINLAKAAMANPAKSLKAE